MLQRVAEQVGKRRNFKNICFIWLFCSCDNEYEERVKQRNNSTIAMIEDIIAYKKDILRTILEFPDIQVMEKIFLAVSFNC